MSQYLSYVYRNIVEELITKYTIIIINNFDECSCYSFCMIFIFFHLLIIVIYSCETVKHQEANIVQCSHLVSF